MRYGQQRALLAPASRQAVELSGQVAGLAVAGRPRRFGQGPLEPTVSRRAAVPLEFTSRFFGPRTHARPRTQMDLNRELAHVDPDLRDHILDGAAIDSYHLVPAVYLLHTQELSENRP